MTKKVMQQALDALLDLQSLDSQDVWLDRWSDAITAIKAALAQPVQEPVAWMVKLGNVTCFQHHADSKHASVPLYTTPPLRERKPLTDEQIEHLLETCVGTPSLRYPIGTSDWVQFARAIEAAHNIKET